MDPHVASRAEEILGHRFLDRSLLAQALLHASDASTRLQSNERLEFLGDAVLSIVVCDHLFRTYPELLEGELTKIKSNVVSRRLCAEIATSLDLLPMMRLGKGMVGQDVIPASLAAAAFEALIGALYLDAGMETTRRFILTQVGPHIERAAKLGHQQNFKSVLQQALQRGGGAPPSYLVLDEKGPDHAKCFEIAVTADARRFPGAWGTSKKAAEQLAALAALRELGLAVETGDGQVQIVWPGSQVQ